MSSDATTTGGGNPPWKTILLFTLLAVAVVMIFWEGGSPKRPASLAETRQALRPGGFKAALADFDLSTPAEFREREAVLASYERPRAAAIDQATLNLLPRVGGRNWQRRTCLSCFNFCRARYFCRDSAAGRGSVLGKDKGPGAAEDRLIAAYRFIPKVSAGGVPAMIGLSLSFMNWASLVVMCVPACALVRWRLRTVPPGGKGNPAV